MYQLKKGLEAFMPVEGPLAGRKFVPGQTYAEIPPGEAKRFAEIILRQAQDERKAARGEPVEPQDALPAAVAKKTNSVGTDLKSIPLKGGKS